MITLARSRRRAPRPEGANKHQARPAAVAGTATGDATGRAAGHAPASAAARLAIRYKKDNEISVKKGQKVAPQMPLV
jgi:hypothetical protein